MARELKQAWTDITAAAGRSESYRRGPASQRRACPLLLAAAAAITLASCSEAPAASTQPGSEVPAAGSPAPGTLADAAMPSQPPRTTPPARDAAAPQPSAAGSGATREPVDPDDAGVSAADAAAPSPGDVIATIRNGGFWQTVDGQRIEAHGGGFLFEAGTWYWIGEDKSHNSANFRAVNCYASRDLTRWEHRNAIITRDTAPELRAADRIIERPKVIYNARTNKYVIWLHWEGMSYATAEAGVFSSDSVCGDYTFHDSFRPNGNMSRDDTLFQDDDGKAYFVSAARENADLIVYELSDDYLSIARQLVTLWAASYREAPALFKDSGRYFLVTSGATGWDPNQAKYATATSLAGPWSALQNLGSGTTYDTQPTFVVPIRGTQTTTYVYAGDRWQDPDLGSSKYIWLPLKLSGTSLTLDEYEQWTLNLTTGEWSARDDYLPQAGWKLLGATSEETEAENGAATRAFDDSSSTFWHTRYSGGTTPLPHELRIDLGVEYSLTGMRHLPRQDGNENGTIAQYELYASPDPNDWGTPVSRGTFDSGPKATTVTFAAKRARYVRLIAIREIGGRSHTSLAELDFAGTLQ